MASICRRTSSSTCASSTRAAANWRRAATSPRCARNWARPRKCRLPQARPCSEKRGIRKWDFGDLPETLVVTRGAQRLTGYPALVDDGDSVSLAMRDTRDGAEASTRAGVMRLLKLNLKDATARFDKGGPGFAQAALQLKTAIATDRLLADVLAAATDRAFIGDDPLPRNERAFADQVKRARTRLPAVAEGAFRLLADIAAEHAALGPRLAGLPPAQSRLAAEVRAQRDALVYPGFFSATPWPQLQHLPRYLKALDRRARQVSPSGRIATPGMPNRSRSIGSATGNGQTATPRPGAPSRRSRRSGGCWRNSGYRCSRRS